jgi:hypothetical protein
MFCHCLRAWYTAQNLAPIRLGWRQHGFAVFNLLANPNSSTERQLSPTPGEGIDVASAQVLPLRPCFEESATFFMPTLVPVTPDAPPEEVLRNG